MRGSLRDLPRGLRRALHARLRRRLAATLLGAALLLAFNPAHRVHAATITVDGSGCTLDQAIRTANDGSEQGSCVQGDPAGADTIVLTGDVALAERLPAIETEIVLEGNGHTITGPGTARVLTVYYGDLTLNEATITGGAVDLDTTLDSIYRAGGGNYNNGGVVTINNSTITDNSALYGGGPFNYGSDAVMTINNSTVSGNDAVESDSAGGMGGGIYNGATLVVNNSTISGNVAALTGGGIADTETLAVRNSTITGKSADEGGGFYTSDGAANLSRSIISGNTAYSSGHEIWLSNFSGSISADDNNVIGYDGSARSEGFTVAGGSSDHVPVGGLPTILNAALGSNGGPTATHALVSGSPAIDIAPNADCTGDPINGLDQRGVTRNIDGKTPDAPGSECDAAAYEYEGDPTAVRINGATVHSGGGAGSIPALSALLLALSSAVYRLRTRPQP